MKAVSQDIIRWLPHLRRHAHALTGSRERSDSYVMACLSVIVAEPDRLRSDGDVRFGLFQLFHTIWQMIDSEYPACDADPAVGELALCQGLAELPPLNRQILLLHAMEGFSEADTARITSVPLQVVTQALAAARAQIRGRLEYRTPLDFYRQARPRRALRQPARRPVAAGGTRPTRIQPAEKSGERPWSAWPA
jgi:Sigma-70, region 4